MGSGLIYLAFTLPFPLSRYYAVNPPVDYTKLTQYSGFGFGAFLMGVLSLFGLYWFQLRNLTKKGLETNHHSAKLVLLSSGAFGLILLFSYPIYAIDLLVYALYGRGWALYGLMPFATPPNAFPPGDPWLGLAGEWADSTSPYGSVWEGLSLGAFHLGAGDYLAHLFILKAISLLAFLGSVWLVYQILRLIRPRWAVIGMAFFALNPLVLIESVQNAHNDTTMMFFFLVAIWAYIRLMQGVSGKKRFLISGLFVIAFSFSILIKFITLLALPILLLGLAFQQRSWLRRIITIVVIGGLIALFVVLSMVPFWPGADNWAVLQAGQGAGRSFFALLVLTIKSQAISTAAAFDMTTTFIYAVFGCIYLWALWQVVRVNYPQPSSPDKQLETPLLASFYVFFWYVLIVASVFHAWYLLWFVPLAAVLIPAKRPVSVAFIFSLAALLIMPYYETVRVWIPTLNRNHLLGHAIGVSLLLIPVLISLWRPIPLFQAQELD